MKYLLVALAVALGDVCWTLYFIETGKKHAVLAGAWSSMIVLFSGFTVIQYAHDPHYLGAAAVGAFIGTWATVRFKK